jgi:hypothetical protein
MTIEQTIEIPDSHRVYLDVPPEIPSGRARIVISILEYSETGVQRDGKSEYSPPDAIEAFSNEDEATEFATRLSMQMIHESR